MSLPVRKSDLFIADFDLQFRWYDGKAGWEVAQRYLTAVHNTLEKLSRLPDLGRVRHFPQPELQRIRSILVERPYDRHLIFYRFDKTMVEAWRVMAGERDLPRRLMQPPGME